MQTKTVAELVREAIQERKQKEEMRRQEEKEKINEAKKVLDELRDLAAKEMECLKEFFPRGEFVDNNLTFRPDPDVDRFVDVWGTIHWTNSQGSRAIPQLHWEMTGDDRFSYEVSGGVAVSIEDFRKYFTDFVVCEYHRRK